MIGSGLQSVSVGETSTRYNESPAEGAAHGVAAEKFLPSSPIEDGKTPLEGYASGELRFESGPQEPLLMEGLPPGSGQFASRAEPAVATPGNPSSVEAATARVSQQGGQLTEAEATDVLRAAGAPEEWIPDMLTIAWCESKYSPGAVGDSGNSLGFFQLWSGWFYPGEDPFDALTNAKVAVRVREIRGRFGGAGGWSCAGLNGIP